MSANRVGNPDGSTGNMPVTQALYGKSKRPRRPQKPQRGPSRHTFAVADQLDSETKRKLAALQGRLEKKQSRRRGRPSRKAVSA